MPGRATLSTGDRAGARRREAASVPTPALGDHAERQPSDRGSAMMIVMGTASILFVLVTMLVTLTVYQSSEGHLTEERQRALQVADAGLYAYLYGMSKDTNYASDCPTLGPVATPDGTYIATVSKGSGTDVIVRSVGTASVSGIVRTVTAEVGYPTFADYAMLGDTSIVIGQNAVVNGAVRMNGSVQNEGTVNGPIFSASTIQNDGYAQACYPDTDTVDFNAVTADVQSMETVAQGENAFFANPTGKLGYRLVLNGTSYSVYTVDSGDKTLGGLVYSSLPVKTGTIPPSGILFFDSDVWVSGDYGADLTVASNYDILLPDDLVRADPSAPYTCGLVARSDVLITAGYPLSQMKNDITIEAAWLALTGKAACDGLEDSTTILRGKATILGSRAWHVYEGFVTSDNKHGFSSREYTYDERLNVNPPPMFPPVASDGHLKIITWVSQ